MQDKLYLQNLHTNKIKCITSYSNILSIQHIQYIVIPCELIYHIQILPARNIIYSI